MCPTKNPTDGDVKAFTNYYDCDSFLPHDIPNHTNQETIWKDVGKELLDAACAGYNATHVLKQVKRAVEIPFYAWFGKGILPRACDAIFEKMDRCKDT